MSSTASGTKGISTDERDAIIEELKRQNEAMALELRSRMESELKDAMAKMLDQFQQQYQEMSLISPPKMPSRSIASDVPRSEPGKSLRVRAEAEAGETSASIRLGTINSKQPASTNGGHGGSTVSSINGIESSVPRFHGGPMNDRVSAVAGGRGGSSESHHHHHHHHHHAGGTHREAHTHAKTESGGVDDDTDVGGGDILSPADMERLPSSVRRMIKKSEILLHDQAKMRKSKKTATKTMKGPSSHNNNMNSTNLSGHVYGREAVSPVNDRYDINQLDSSQSFGKNGKDKSRDSGANFGADDFHSSKRREKHVNGSTGQDGASMDVKSHSDWENNIARHILSVYASSISVIDKITSKATLEFVEGHTAHSDVSKLALNPSVALADSSEEGGTWPKLPVSGKFHVEHLARIRGGGGRVVVIRAPPKCFPIWFSASQDVFYDWSTACTDDLHGQKLQAHLNSLREEKRYMEYLKAIQTVLEMAWDEIIVAENESERAKKLQPSGFDEVITKRSAGGKRPLNITAAASERKLTKADIKQFWRQLVYCANAFATLTIEGGDSNLSLLIIDLIESWVSQDFLFSGSFRFEIKCYLYFTLAHYFFRNTKYAACLSNCIKGTEFAQKRGDMDLVAIGNIRMSCAHLQRGDFVKAHECLYVVLSMIEDGSLAVSDPTPERLCLVALTYHNLAITQLKLLCPEDAIKNSFNAQRIARLCLSMTNRWLPMMHWTHQICLNEVEYDLRQTDIVPDEKRDNVEKLMEMMYTTTK